MRLLSLPRVVPVLLVACTQSACFFVPGIGRGYGAAGFAAAAANAQVSAQQRTDDQMWKSLEAARAKVKADPGGVDAARVFSQNVLGVFELGTAKRKAADGEALLLEANGALDAAVTAHPESKAELMFSRGGMLLSAGKTDDGVIALRASMDAKASPRACVTLIAELDKQGDPKKEIVPLCKKARPNAASDETKYALLEGCLTHSHGKNADEGLKWAGKADIAFYKDYAKKIDAENEAKRREDQARADQQRAEMDADRARDDERRRAQQSSGGSSGSSSGGGNKSGGGSSAPSTWSLTLHNSCSKTVKLFFGDKPKFGSGKYTTLGSNNVTSYTGSPGDMIWIVDDSENGISSMNPSGRQNMQITSSCSGFSPY